MADHLQPDELEDMRRSAAAGDVSKLLESHQALVEEREQLRAIVARLGHPSGEVADIGTGLQPSSPGS